MPAERIVTDHHIPTAHRGHTRRAVEHHSTPNPVLLDESQQYVLRLHAVNVRGRPSRVNVRSPSQWSSTAGRAPSSREARSRRTRAPAYGGGDRVTPAATLR